MKFTRKFSNISERRMLGKLFSLFTVPIRISIADWSRQYRRLTSEESVHTGRFDPLKIPAMEYLYDCCYNKKIYIIVTMKASQIGWSELINNVIGWMIHTSPCKAQLCFASLEASKVFAREKLKPFFEGNKVLRDRINIGVAKASFNYFKFPSGMLKLTTLGAIAASKSSSIAYMFVEEPSDVKDDVANQGDTFANVQRRQETFDIGQKKMFYGGTPTNKDFCRVEAGFKQSNRLVFKAECHHCQSLVQLSLDNLKYDEYPDNHMDEIYGKQNPYSAYYACPDCLGTWSFEDKMSNIENGKRFGFTDFTGAFSKGWHPEKPEITDIFGFHIPELLSTLPTSTFVDLAKKRILADLELAKGNEGLLKSYVNNSEGLPYASGISALEPEEMKLHRKNYPEDIVPMEGLVLTAGIDVQDNRLAYVIRAWGRDNRSWLVKWEEIFGDVKNQDDLVWQELTDKLVNSPIPHAAGKFLRIAGVSIDSGDNTELVYKWVLKVSAIIEARQEVPMIFATKGVRDLRWSDNEIYLEPMQPEESGFKQTRKSLAETMGVTLYKLGAHRAHEEILNRIALNTNKEARSNVYYFNDQAYGQYEEQMMTCRKIIDVKSSYTKSVFKLVAGKRKEAMDAEKNALHASYALNLRNYKDANWRAVEDYLFR